MCRVFVTAAKILRISVRVRTSFPPFVAAGSVNFTRVSPRMVTYSLRSMWSTAVAVVTFISGPLIVIVRVSRITISVIISTPSGSRLKSLIVGVLVPLTGPVRGDTTWAAIATFCRPAFLFVVVPATKFTRRDSRLLWRFRSTLLGDERRFCFFRVIYLGLWLRIWLWLLQCCYIVVKIYKFTSKLVT